MGATTTDISIAPAEVVTAPSNPFKLTDRNDLGPSGIQPSLWVVVTVVVGAVLLDQVTKTVAVGALASGPDHVWILHLRLVANRGIFMGMIGLPIWLITSLTLVIVVWAARAGWRSYTALASIGYALLIAGAVGNLVDRYLQRPDFPANAVVDWLSFGGMTFNLADVFLVVAVVILIRSEPPQPATVADAPT